LDTRLVILRCKRIKALHLRLDLQSGVLKRPFGFPQILQGGQVIWVQLYRGSKAPSETVGLWRHNISFLSVVSSPQTQSPSDNSRAPLVLACFWTFRDLKWTQRSAITNLLTVFLYSNDASLYPTLLRRCDKHHSDFRSGLQSSVCSTYPFRAFPSSIACM
jgi:hypothetical protein